MFSIHVGNYSMEEPCFDQGIGPFTFNFWPLLLNIYTSTFVGKSSLQIYKNVLYLEIMWNRCCSALNTDIMSPPSGAFTYEGQDDVMLCEGQHETVWQRVWNHQVMNHLPLYRHSLSVFLCLMLFLRGKCIHYVNGCKSNTKGACRCTVTMMQLVWQIRSSQVASWT